MFQALAAGSEPLAPQPIDLPYRAADSICAASWRADFFQARGVQHVMTDVFHQLAGDRAHALLRIGVRVACTFSGFSFLQLSLKNRKIFEVVDTLLQESQTQT